MGGLNEDSAYGEINIQLSAYSSPPEIEIMYITYRVETGKKSTSHIMYPNYKG